MHRVFVKYFCGIYILYYLAQVEGTVHRVFVSKRPGVDDFMRQVPQLLLYGPKKLYKCSCCGGPASTTSCARCRNCYCTDPRSYTSARAVGAPGAS